MSEKVFSFLRMRLGIISSAVFVSFFIISTVFILGAMADPPLVTPATGGTGISIDTTSGTANEHTGSGAFTSLTSNIIITEPATSTIALGVHTFSLPAGWEFDTSSQVTVGSNAAESGLNYIPQNIIPNTSTFSIRILNVSTDVPAILSFGNIKVRPTGTNPATINGKHIYHSAGIITGVVNGTDGADGENFGDLSTVPGTATHLKVTTDVGTINAGGTVNATIRAYDQFDNLVSYGANNYTGSKNLTFYFNNSEVAAAHQSPNFTDPTTGGSNLGTQISVTFTNGVSTAVAVIPVKIETADIDVSDSTINSTGDVAYDAAVTVTPGNFNTFVIDLVGTATAGTATTTRLYAYDAYGNTTDKDENGTDFTTSESVTFTSTATVAPDGTTKPTYNGLDMTGVGQVVDVNLSAGWFTSSDIIFYNAGETPTVTAQHGTKSAVSAAINVAHAAADHLKFSGAVGAQVAGVQFALPALQAMDLYGNLADNSDGAAPYASTDVVAYTLSGLANGPISGIDALTTPVTFVNGVSTTDLNTTLYRAQNTTITANSANLTGTDVVSNSFTVSAANAASLLLTTQPAGSVSGVALTAQPVVTAKDAYGNIATSFVDTVTLTPSIGSLSNDAVAAVAGVATFATAAHTATVDNQSVTITADDVVGGVEGDLPASAASDTFNTNVIATHLAFTQQPVAGVNSGAVLGTQPIVIAKGPGEITDTDFVETVTLTVSGGSISGTTAKAAVAGVATFNDVVHTAAVDNTVIHLIADDVVGGVEGDLATVNSAGFTTSVVATKLLITMQPASIVSGVGMTQPVVKYVDANDVVDADIGATDDVTISEIVAGSITSGATTTTASNGVVTFAGLIYSATADQEAVTFTFTDNVDGSKDFSGAGIPSNDLIADVVATKITLTTSPASIVSGISMTQPVVTYQNAQNITDVDVDTDVITITEDGNGSLTGVTTTVASNGVATFAGVIYSALADQETVTLTFADDDVGLVDINPTVNPGALTADVVATKIIFATNASGCVSGSACTTQPIVNAVNAQNVLDTGYTDVALITLTKATGAGVFSVGGTQTFASGVATFAGTTLTASAADHEIYTLNAAIAGDILTAGVSGNIDLNVVADTFVIIDPTDGTVDALINVTVKAQKGTIIDEDYAGAVTLNADGSASGDGIINLTNGTTIVAITDTIAETVNLTLTDHANTRFDVTSSQYVVFGVGAAAKLSFTVQPSTPHNAGVAFTTQPSVTIQDQYGNTRSADTDTITLAAFTNNTCLTASTSALQGTLTKAATVGVADFSGNGVNHTKAETLYLKATTGGLTPACSTAVVINAGVFGSFNVVPATYAPTTGTAFNVTVTAADSYGNAVTAFTGQVNFSTTATAPYTVPSSVLFTAENDKVASVVFNVVESNKTITVWADSEPAKTGVSANISPVSSDAVAPTILSHYPADNATSVNLSVAPYIDFSEALNPTTANSTNIQLKKYSDDSTITAVVSLEEGNTRIKITPSSNLVINTQYYFAVSTLVRDANGNALASALDASTKTSHEFTTTVGNILTVESYSPIDGTTGVAIAAGANPTNGIWIKFSEALDPTTIPSSVTTADTGNVRIRYYINGADFATTVPATLTLQEGNTKVIITPSSSLDYGTKYFFFIGAGVKSVSGRAIETPWYHSDRASHEFTTGTSLVVDSLTLQQGTVSGYDEYLKGWIYKFKVTVNNLSENTLKLRLADWARSSGGGTVTTDGNTRLLFNTNDGSDFAATGLTENQITSGSGTISSYAVGSAVDYSGSDAVGVDGKDADVTASGRQLFFYVYVKVASTTPSGFYGTSYGILTQE